MDGLVWAFGSTLIVMLIVYFLPLSLTKKGKITLVLTSFILALGGMAATASFSFLLAVLLIVVLIVFVTYIMDQRLGKWIYNEDDSIKEQGNEDFFMNTEMETAASLEKLHQQKNESTLEPLPLLKEKTTGSETEQESEANIPVFEAEEDDISFLLNRSISLEKETSENAKEKKKDESDYLSEIEEFLKDHSDDQSNSAVNNQSIMDDPHEIPVISFDDKPLKKKDSSKSAKKIEDFDEIPVLPFHEKEGV